MEKITNLLRDEKINISLNVTTEQLRDFGKYLIEVVKNDNKTTSVILTSKEVVALTGYSINTINKKVSKREMPHYKQGGRVFFHRDEIESWLLSGKRETVQEFVKQKL